jgi:hypothetical protein
MGASELCLFGRAVESTPGSCFIDNNINQERDIAASDEEQQLSQRVMPVRKGRQSVVHHWPASTSARVSECTEQP